MQAHVESHSLGNFMNVSTRNVIYDTSQPLLEKVLYKEVMKEEHQEYIDIKFNHDFKSIESEKDQLNLHAVNTETGSNTFIGCSHVLAADGAYSNVRDFLVKFRCFSTF